MSWRDQIRPIVSEIVDRVGKGDPDTLKRALLEGRPEWVRACSHQTKVWRDEVKRQTEESDTNGVSARATDKGVSVRHWDKSKESRESDLRHYKRIAAEVETWPKWKQNLLRDSLEPTLPFAREPVQAKCELCDGLGGYAIVGSKGPGQTCPRCSGTGCDPSST